jgi:hypothetical protein
MPDNLRAKDVNDFVGGIAAIKDAMSLAGITSLYQISCL